ncbi:hypothetical protein ABEF95_002423 [Exophiala dermatitidis]
MLKDDGAPLTVAYLGPEASFSHQAAIGVFGPTTSTSTSTPLSSSPASASTSSNERLVSLHPLPSFSAIFSAIQNSPSSSSSSAATSETKEQIQYDFDFAVIPIENSTNGSVVQVLDLLAQCGHETETETEPESTALSPSSAAAAATARPALYPDVEVCAEYYLPVHHCLFVAPSSVAEHEHGSAGNHGHDDGSNSSTTKPDPPKSIRTLYTHPQVWGQCGRYLAAHFPPTVVERIDMGSTSAAAQLVAREGAAKKEKPQSISHCNSTCDSVDPAPAPGISAAIASKLAGEKHNLVCLAENIEDEPGSNTTRFFVVRNRNHNRNSQQQLPKHLHTEHTHTQQYYYKSLITFTIDHTRPGSLADALAVFKQYSFNLTSIDTRPSRKRNWQYVFFVECETTHPQPEPAAGSGHKDQKLTNMLRDLRKFTESLRYLGRFEDQLRTQ